MALVFTALNMGLFAAVTTIGSGHFPTGIGFRLFDLLSLVRLRSAAFTLNDVAHTFVAGLICESLVSRGRVKRRRGWLSRRRFGSGWMCRVVSSGSVDARGQTDMRGLVTAGPRSGWSAPLDL